MEDYMNMTEEQKRLYERIVDNSRTLAQIAAQNRSGNGQMQQSMQRSQPDLAQRFVELHQDFKVFIDADNEDFEMPEEPRVVDPDEMEDEEEKFGIERTD